eukprot:COSAG04_NODE_729_length_10753_cov_2.112728_5_plen_64_part_00
MRVQGNLTVDYRKPLPKNGTYLCRLCAPPATRPLSPLLLLLLLLLLLPAMHRLSADSGRVNRG